MSDMTERMVSVPVEPTLPLHPESARIAAALRDEAQRRGKGVPTDLPGFHKDLWTAAEIIDMAEEGRAFDHQMNAMLSAAPAPEGGAVRAWMFRESPSERWHVTLDRRDVDEYLKAFSTAEAYPLGLDSRDEAPESIKAAYKRGWNDRESDILERAERALPPSREEAPAEAGYRECGWCDGRKTKQTPSTDFTIPCPYCKGTGKEALRAQPQAREEAQPVAWLHTVYQGLDEASSRLTYHQEQPFGQMGTEKEYRVTTQPLYPTPPAPETEKLREIAEAARVVRQCAWTDRSSRIHGLAAVEALQKALTALQQEGR